MAYTPTEWKNGDVITAEKLNNLEEGIDTNRLPIITILETPGMTTTYSCDMTYEELKALLPQDRNTALVHVKYGLTVTLGSNWENIGTLFCLEPATQNSNMIIYTIGLIAAEHVSIAITSQNEITVTKTKL